MSEEGFETQKQKSPEQSPDQIEKEGKQELQPEAEDEIELDSNSPKHIPSDDENGLQEKDNKNNDDDDEELEFNEASSDHEEEETTTRRRRLRTKREAERELDEDDLALIKENALGLDEDEEPSKLQKPKKKTRKVELQSPDDLKEKVASSLFGDRYNDTEEFATSISTDSRYLPDDDDEEEEGSSEDDLRAFVVELDEHGNEVPISQRKRRVNRRREISQVGASKLAEAEDLFGDVYQLDDYDMEEFPNELSESQKIESKTEILRRTYGPDVVKERLLTEEDEEIRSLDIPERVQLKFRDSKGRSQLDRTELSEEAMWIWSQTFRNREVPYHAMVQKIATVLDLMLNKKFDVPYIYQYKADLWQPEMSQGMADLWQVWDFDDKWSRLSRKKNIAKRILEDIFSPRRIEENREEQQQEEEEEKENEEKKTNDLDPSHSKLLELLKSAENENQVQDILDWVTIEFRDRMKETGVSSASTTKRAIRKDFYRLCIGAGLESFVRSFSITASQLGNNIEQDISQHEPFDPDDLPEGAALAYLGNEFKTLESVLKAATTMLAMEISAEPNFRMGLRTVYRKHAWFSTTPTVKGRTLDAWHPYKIVAALDHKPVAAFSHDRYIVMLKAEREGFIHVQLGQDDEMIHEEFIKPLEKWFLSSSLISLSAESWNSQRRLALQSAVRLLIPILQKEIREELREAASTFIGDLVQSWVFKTAFSGCYKPPNSTNVDNVIVMAAVCSSQMSDPTHCVILDGSGQVIQSIKVTLNYFGGRGPQEANEELKNFIKTHQPVGICVPARPECKKLLAKLDEICLAIAQSQGTEKIHTTYVDGQIPRIFSVSERAANEFPTHPAPLLEAISLGRLLQNPFLEVTYLASALNYEILGYSFHPHQDFVEKDYLIKRITRSLINCTCFIGIDINRANQQPWAAGPLQFVSGLGARKAPVVLQWVFRNGGIVTNRADLLEPLGPLGPLVYENAIPFLRINKKYLEDTSDATRLDDTRIHPQDYPLVIKLAEDVLAEQKLTGEDLIDMLFDHPSCLEGIDWVRFGEALKEKGKTNKTTTLQSIKDEIEQPFMDNRFSYSDPGPELVWKLMMGEDEDNLVGQLVTAQVVLIKDELLVSRLENGIEALVQKSDLTDSQIRSIREDVQLSKGDAFPARIKLVDRERLLVYLVSRQSELTNSKWEEARMKMLQSLEPYLNVARLVNEKRIPTKRKKSEIKRKRLEHPLFHDLKFEEAQTYLAQRPEGYFIIRPSSKSFQMLTITVKICKDVYEHITVRVDEANSGKRGFMIGSKRFEDMDELISTFIEPRVENYLTILNHKSFCPGNKTSVEQICLQEKQHNPKGIPYHFAVDHEHPGKFILLYVPNSRVHCEFVNVTPEGFRFRKATFPDPNRLIAWFKKHWRDPLPSSQSSNTAPRAFNSNSNNTVSQW